MKTTRAGVAVLAGVLLACGAWADDAPLDVRGVGVKQVYVAEKTPFFVHAPAGGAIYVWQVPAGVAFNDLEDKIEVTEAPAGKLTFGVRVKSIDKLDYDPEKKTVTRITWKTDVGKVEVNVGGLGPTPVDPTPDEARPSAALVKAMQEAYDAEADPRKAADLVTFINFTAGIVKALKNNGSVKTVADFQRLGHAAANEMLKLDLGNGQIRPGDGVLTNVRKAAAEFVAANLPREMNHPVDEDYWKKAATRYSQVSQAMKKVAR